MREERPLWEGEQAGGLIEGKCAALMTFSEAAAAERDPFILAGRRGDAGAPLSGGSAGHPRPPPPRVAAQSPRLGFQRRSSGNGVSSAKATSLIWESFQ